MPHAGHFICADQCKFRLYTYVGGYVVSTVGEMVSHINPEQKEWEDLGFNRKYETYVFKAKKVKNDCCKYVPSDFSEIDSLGANDQKTAMKNHIELCNKWSRKIK